MNTIQLEMTGLNIGIVVLITLLEMNGGFALQHTLMVVVSIISWLSIVMGKVLIILLKNLGASPHVSVYRMSNSCRV